MADNTIHPTAPNALYRLRDWWQAQPALTRGLILLVGLRLLIALIFMLDVLPLDLRYRWFLKHGGDQDLFFRMASSFIAGTPEPEIVGPGQAFIMTPFVMLYRPYNTLDVIAPLVLINGFALGGASVYLVGWLAKYTTGSDRVALWAAGAWAILPLLTYFAFFWHFDPVLLRSSNVPKVGWLNSLSDGPATFWVLAAAALLAASLKDERMPGYFWRMVFAGAAMGLAVTFRVHIIPMVAVMMLYVLLAHDYRALILVLIGAAIAYIPNAWYNQTVFDVPITIGYIAYFTVHETSEFAGGLFSRPLSDILLYLPFSPSVLLDNVTYHFGRRPWLVVPLLGGLIAAGYAVVQVWRRYDWRAIVLLLGLPLAYLGPMVLTWPFREDPIRFSIPAMPFAMIVGAFVVFAIIDRGRSEEDV